MRLEKPLLSLIIPIYNVEKYLDECLESVINQSFKDYEVILVDDGSTDSSGKTADCYAEKYGYISVIHKENGGLSSARNVGIENSKGKYLFFIDSDDVLNCEHALENLAQHLNVTQPELLLHIPKEYDEQLKNTICTHKKGKWDEYKVFKAIEILDELYYSESVWVTMAQTKIIRNDFCKANKLFFVDKIYHEDDEWIARTLNCNPCVAFFYQPIYGYRHRDNSIIATTDEKKIYKKLCDRIIVASSMLNNEQCCKNTAYLVYVFEYLFNSMVCSVELKGSYSDDFCKFAKKKTSGYTRLVFKTMNIKLIIKYLYIKFFGIKRFITKYER